MIDTKPQQGDLTTPESAVRSYLDWVSYASRLGQSQLATATMTATEGVRVDAYIQYNLQEQKRLLDQKLISISFSGLSIKGNKAQISTKEHWGYRHLSTTEPGKVIADPKEIDYVTTYHLVKQDGKWVVDSVEIKSQSPTQ